MIYYTSDREKTVYPTNGTDFSLKELQGIVGGYIETLTLKDGKLMVVNEEGKLQRLAVNSRATQIANENGYADIIVGNVLVCEAGEIK